MRQRIDKRRDAGFTYLTVLLAIVVMGVMLGTTTEVWHTAMQRERERELLFAGNQFRTAIGLYYLSHKRFPRNLEDLLKDPQFASTKRYLRRIVRDPMTGGTEWAVVRSTDGGIMGVHSLSEMSPLKVAGFKAAGNRFDGAVKYSDWVFAYIPRQISAVPKPNSDSGGDKPLW